MIYYWDKCNGGHLECVLKICILWARVFKSIFFNCYYISFQYMQTFFEFLASVINHYYINGLHLFCNSFELFCLQISSDAKYFFLSSPRHCDQGLTVVIVYYFKIWIKKEHNIIIRRVIRSHMDLMYIETPCTLSIYIYILFTNPSARAGYDTRSIFKRSLTGLNSEFSFS